AKRMPAGSVRLTNRGEIGTQAFRFAEPKDALVGLLQAVPGTDVKLFTNSGRVLRSAMDAIAFWGKMLRAIEFLTSIPVKKLSKLSAVNSHWSLVISH
ncbi:MAG: hypothetical protein M3N42_10130, partial [Cyanobacteriota bacterium]|nr:hypothetical protein [Cyanobacteriota bacterium]